MESREITSREWQIPYVKVEGAGNICLVVEREQIPFPGDKMRDFVQAITDKETGLDADQLLEVISRRPLHFQVWNKDGSASGMCGNGARALLRLAEEEGWLGKIQPHSEVPLQIGIRHCSAARLDKPGAFKVNLGGVRVSPRQEFFFEQLRIPYWPVDVGNPHAVIFCGPQDWPLPKNFSLAGWGPKLCGALKANIEFVLPVDRFQSQRLGHPYLKVLVWELGAGPTMACGSGAVAVAGAFQSRQKSLESQFLIEMPGGVLNVEIGPFGAFLAGPSSILQRGNFSYSLN